MIKRDMGDDFDSDDISRFTEFCTPEETARRMEVPTAFVRLVMELGCAVKEDKTSPGAVANFLHTHTNEVRAACGLEVLPDIEHLSDAKRRYQHVLNGYLTMGEFAVSRATKPEHKELWEERLRFAKDVLKEMLGEDEPDE